MRRSPPATLKRRAEFLHAASRGQKLARPGFVMQVVKARPSAELRVGFTASRKVGNAVVRNRARRRLREMVRLTLAESRISGMELVLIARRDTARIEFATLCKSFAEALERMLPKSVAPDQPPRRP
jgi:ribonuclease P protein component